MGYIHYKDDEVAFIKNNYGKISTQEIAKQLNKTYSQITKKATRMGLKRKEITGEYWSDKEDTILKEHFEYAPKQFIEKLLPNREWCGILQRGLKTHNLNRISQDRFSVNYNFFSKWTPESAYLFGLIMADGHIRIKELHGMNCMSIQLAGYDLELLEKIKALLQYEGNIETSQVTGKVRLQVNNAKIVQDLINLGMPQENKTFEAKWPESLPKELESHFVRGLLDGDGTICQCANRSSLTISFLGTFSLMASLNDALPTVRKNHICDRASYKNGGANVFNIRYGSRKDTKNILDWIYKDATIYLERKYQKYREFYNL